MKISVSFGGGGGQQRAGIGANDCIMTMTCEETISISASTVIGTRTGVKIH